MSLPTTAPVASDTLRGPRALAPALDVAALAAHVPVLKRKLRAGQYLYRSGQAFNALYVVHAGFLRTSIVTDDGREQITGFPMRGDLLGVEAIGAGAHVSDAIALDDCDIVELPYPAVMTACLASPELQGMFTAALAREIRRDREWLLALGTLTAEQRVATFLLDVAARHAALGFSGAHFVLRMSRVDIGSFLALKHETVTRALSNLTAQGIIAVERRDVRVLDAPRLQASSRGADAPLHRAA